MAIIDVTARFLLAPVWWRGIRSGPGDVTTYALHYIDDEGTVPGPDATQAEEIAYLDAIHRYHLAVGYGGFGYHLAAFASGRVYLCTPLNRWGANVLGKNDEVIGVLLVFTGHVVPLLSTREAAAKAVEYSDDMYVGHSPLRPTRGHRELVGTSCPGDRYQEWVPQLRSLIEEEDDMELADLTQYMANIRQKLDMTNGLTDDQRVLSDEERRFDAEIREASKRHVGPHAAGGDAYTDAQAVDAVRDKLSS